MRNGGPGHNNSTQVKKVSMFLLSPKASKMGHLSVSSREVVTNEETEAQATITIHKLKSFYVLTFSQSQQDGSSLGHWNFICELNDWQCIA